MINRNRSKEQSSNSSLNKPILSKSINKPVLSNLLNIQMNNKNLKKNDNIVIEKNEMINDLNSNNDKYYNNKYRFSVSNSKNSHDQFDKDSYIPEIDSEVEEEYYNSYLEYKNKDNNSDINQIPLCIKLDQDDLLDNISNKIENCKLNEYLINPPMIELTSFFIEYDRRYSTYESYLNN
jgi:hypothetical protein